MGVVGLQPTSCRYGIELAITRIHPTLAKVLRFITASFGCFYTAYTPKSHAVALSSTP